MPQTTVSFYQRRFQKISPRQEGTVMGVLLDFDEDTMQIYVDGVCYADYSYRFSGGRYSWGVLLDKSLRFRGAVKVKRRTPPPLESAL